MIFDDFSHQNLHLWEIFQCHFKFSVRTIQEKVDRKDRSKRLAG